MSAQTNSYSILAVSIALFFSLTALLAPADVLAITPSAKKGADEKNFVNSASRCLTPVMKKLNASMVKRMKTDIAAAEKRLGIKFGSTITLEKPQPVEKRICSSEDILVPRLCVVGPMAAGFGYRVEFYNLFGKRSDMIVISPVQGGESSPTLSVQASMTNAATSGTVAFEGLSSDSYVAYGFTNPNGVDREYTPRLSVAFTVDAQPVMATSTIVVANKKDPAAIYREQMDTVWAAMAQPYCGFGSKGITAVKKSYNKNVGRARQTFLKATKTYKP